MMALGSPEPYGFAEFENHCPSSLAFHYYPQAKKQRHAFPQTEKGV